jgi:oligopeptide/dipeptide ABC transporter ATP-binding protein
VHELHTHVITRHSITRAVDGVSFDIGPGEALGLVGESGCGKSMTASSIVRLFPTPAARIVSGSIRLAGQELTTLPPEEMRRLRGRSIATILQDPLAALNPVFRVGFQLAEPLRGHFGLTGAALRDEVTRLLSLVRVDPPATRMRSLPHELSGGMRQRVVTAMAVSARPELLLADEPTSSLDVTTQRAVLRMLKGLQGELGMAMLLITHDLGVVRRTCDRVAVMYAGRIVEHGPVGRIVTHPAHPYTIALQACVPRPSAHGTRLTSIPGQPPDLRRTAPGCAFAPRCLRVRPRCLDQSPPPVVVSPQHVASCWDLQGGSG